jgi:hypothetical protein
MSMEMQRMLRKKLNTSGYIDKGGRFRWATLLTEDVNKVHEDIKTTDNPNIRIDEKKTPKSSVI